MSKLNIESALMNVQELGMITHARYAIVKTEWSDAIVAALTKGCKNAMQPFEAELTQEWAVPGCFELPFACKKLWETAHNKSNAPEAIIAFGAVIRGGTPHFDYVCKAVTDGILQLNLKLPIPVIFGVLTLDNEAQAWERLGGVHGHKGEEAAITALKMIRLVRG
jgi:6,7-dimethyl-8-ribityllumazine synthase